MLYYQQLAITRNQVRFLHYQQLSITRNQIRFYATIILSNKNIVSSAFKWVMTNEEYWQMWNIMCIYYRLSLFETLCSVHIGKAKDDWNSMIHISDFLQEQLEAPW